MTDPNDAPPRLSESGVRRRDRMLRELQDAMPGVRRERRRRRTALGGVLLVVSAAAVAIVAYPRQSVPAPEVARIPEPASRPAGVPERLESHPAPVVDFAFVPSSPDIVDRYAARGTGLIEIIDDDALVATLTAIDRPTGLVRRGDHVWLTAEVVDEL